MNKSYFYLEMRDTRSWKIAPYTGKLRRVRVLLPKNYETDTDRRYPIVYFHDGQNIFYDKEAYMVTLGRWSGARKTNSRLAVP